MGDGLTCYMSDPMNLIDFLATYPPMYDIVTETFFPQAQYDGTGVLTKLLRIVRILRLFRLARVKRLKSLNKSLKILQETIRRSMKDSILIVVTMMCLEALIFAALIYNVENIRQARGCEVIDNDSDCYKSILPNGEVVENVPYSCVWVKQLKSCVGKQLRPKDPWAPYEYEVSPFQSIFYSTWWVFVTITTVGYGDEYPTSYLGKIIGVVCMLSGFVLFSIYVAIFSENFDIAKDRLEK